MSFAKFFSLVSTSSLFFCSGDTLAKLDPFEGCPHPHLAEILRKGQTRLDILDARGDVRQANEQEIKDECDDLPRRNKALLKLRQLVGINSWHVADYESAALWNIYSGATNGIAVKSTVERFCKCFSGDPKDVFTGLIKYIDYNKEVFDNSNNILTQFKAYPSGSGTAHIWWLGAVFRLLPTRC